MGEEEQMGRVDGEGGAGELPLDERGADAGVEVGAMGSVGHRAGFRPME